MGREGACGWKADRLKSAEICCCNCGPTALALVNWQKTAAMVAEVNPSGLEGSREPKECCLCGQECGPINLGPQLAKIALTSLKSAA